MTTALPASINEDTLPVLLFRVGTPFKLNSDAQLHLLGGMPLRTSDLVSEATVTTAHLNAGFSAADATTIVNELRKRKATKA